MLYNAARRFLSELGRVTEVKVYPHRLRHTCATQLLNAGCRITSIRKFLGHKRIESTLTYTKVHNQTVDEDYYMAMRSVEHRLEIITVPPTPIELVSPPEKEQILAIADKLKSPILDTETRLSLAEQLIALVVPGNPTLANAWIPPPLPAVPEFCSV